MKQDENIRNISNIKISSECYIEIKVISVRKQISVQQVAQEILERAMNKKTKQLETSEE